MLIFRAWASCGFTLYLRAIFQVQAPRGGGGGGLIFGGTISRTVFCVTSLGGLFSEFYGSFSMGFKYDRIPVVSKAHLLEFYGVRHLRDWNMAQFVSQCQ